MEKRVQIHSKSLMDWFRVFNKLSLLRNRFSDYMARIGVLLIPLTFLAWAYHQWRTMSTSKEGDEQVESRFELASRYLGTSAPWRNPFSTSIMMLGAAKMLYLDCDSWTELCWRTFTFLVGGTYAYMIKWMLLYQSRYQVRSLSQSEVCGFRELLLASFRHHYLYFSIHTLMTILARRMLPDYVFHSVVLGMCYQIGVYILKTSTIAKVADVVADQRETSKELRTVAEGVDQTFDILADGMITKLVICGVLSLGERSQLLNAYAIMNLTYLLAEVWNLLGSNKLPAASLSDNMFLLPLLCSTVDQSTDLMTTVAVTLSLHVCSTSVIEYLKPWITLNCGSVGLIPTFLAFVPYLANLLSITRGRVGMVLLTIMAMFDQVGYLADILEDSLGKDGRDLDIIGNQLKAGFKFAMMTYLAWDFQYFEQTLTGYGFIAMVGLPYILLFYQYVKSMSDDVRDEEAFLSECHCLSRKLLVASLMTYRLDPLHLQAIVLSGGINDNVKKVLKGKASEDLDSSLVLSDLEGDYKKDVLYPLVVSKYLIFIVTYILALENIYLNEIKHYLSRL